MLRFSPLGTETDVIPQAIFWRPLVYFATNFREGKDDLDHFKAVTFTVDNDFSFDLRNYRGHPEQTVTVYFAFEMQNLEEIAAAIDMVVSETAIPKHAVAWRRGWDFEYGSLHRQDTDRLREPEARMLALKIAARSPAHTTTTEYIKEQVPRYYPLSEIDRRPSLTRKREAHWQQIVGNVISHQKTLTGLFGGGYAIRTREGLSVTERGLDHLNSMGFVIA